MSRSVIARNQHLRISSPSSQQEPSSSYGTSIEYKSAMIQSEMVHGPAVGVPRATLSTLEEVLINGDVDSEGSRICGNGMLIDVDESDFNAVDMRDPDVELHASDDFELTGSHIGYYDSDHAGTQSSDRSAEPGIFSRLQVHCWWNSKDSAMVQFDGCETGEELFRRVVEQCDTRLAREESQLFVVNRLGLLLCHHEGYRWFLDRATMWDDAVRVLQEHIRGSYDNRAEIVEAYLDLPARLDNELFEAGLETRAGQPVDLAL